MSDLITVCALEAAASSASEILLRIDGLRQVAEDHLTRPLLRLGPRRDVHRGAEDSAGAALGGALLAPVEAAAALVDGDADTVPRGVGAVLVGRARGHQDLGVGAVEVAAHDLHALAVGPVELAALAGEGDLLGGPGADLELGHDDLAVGAVEVGGLEGAVVVVKLGAHVGPVHTAGGVVDGDAVRVVRHAGDDGAQVAAVSQTGQDRAEAVRQREAGIEHVETRLHGGTHFRGTMGNFGNNEWGIKKLIGLFSRKDAAVMERDRQIARSWPLIDTVLGCPKQSPPDAGLFYFNLHGLSKVRLDGATPVSPKAQNCLGRTTKFRDGGECRSDPGTSDA
ncbi:hypothetical protein PG989_013672 [Apiospora arundinis]